MVMKINSISFTSTYLKPSIRGLSEKNQKKVQCVYPLGEVCPVDLYLGSNSKGDFTVDITRCSVNKYLASNKQGDFPDEYSKYLPTILALENSYVSVHGPMYPVKKVTIKNLDKISAEDLPYLVADEIVKYEEENNIVWGS